MIELDLQQVRVIKDRNVSVLTSKVSVLRRWMECFEALMNEENEGKLVNWKVAGLNNLPVEV